MLMLMAMVMVVCDLDKTYRNQIVTDPYGNHADCGADSVMPQVVLSLSEALYFKIRYNILARMALLCPIYLRMGEEGGRKRESGKVEENEKISTAQPACDSKIWSDCHGKWG